MRRRRELVSQVVLALVLAGVPACRSAPTTRTVSSAVRLFDGRLVVPAPGPDSVADIAALPLLRFGGLTKQVSSRDPAGGNEDGFAGHSELYVDEHGEHVVFDDFGPGCIYRTWFTAKLAWAGRIRVYVDDLEHPVVDERFLSLFGSDRPPFVAPLTLSATRSSGGFVSYVPIGYQHRAKITLSRPAEFFGITYRHYDADHPVRSFVPGDDLSGLLGQWGHPDRDPKPAASVTHRTGTVTVPGGEARELLAVRGTGAVWNLALDAQPFEQATVSSAWLVARWDDHTRPDVEAPLPELFGSYRTDRPAEGLLVGRHGDSYVIRLPMPYWSAAEIRIENRGRTPLTIRHDVELFEGTYPAASGYFTARYHHEKPTTSGRDYLFAELTGTGHYVGVTYSMHGSPFGTYMEGDERFYVNGARTPAIAGTGTEDYFNGGWYFLFGGFSAPLHGAPYRLAFAGATTSRTGAYRMHVGDLVSFLDGAHFGIEHDRADEDTDDDHSSVAYLYWRPEPSLIWSDDLDVGEPASESAHHYRATGSSETTTLEAVFEGDDDRVRVRDSGRAVGRGSEFEVAVAPANAGVLLRRRFDQERGRQQAEVLVDGESAGTWYDVSANPIQRWAESEFLLPGSLTAGKRGLHVEILNRGEVPWSEYHYRAASVVPPPGA